jgi:hypothetical protein
MNGDDSSSTQGRPLARRSVYSTRRILLILVRRGSPDPAESTDRQSGLWRGQETGHSVNRFKWKPQAKSHTREL